MNVVAKNERCDKYESMNAMNAGEDDEVGRTQSKMHKCDLRGNTTWMRKWLA